MLEVLQDFKSAQPPLEWLVQTIPHLKPRQFSIASSLAKHPNSAHVLMAVVDYKTPFKRRKQGLCSSWLAGLSPITTFNSNVDSSYSHSPQVEAAQGQHFMDASPSGHTDSGSTNKAGAAADRGEGSGCFSGLVNGRVMDAMVPVWVEKGVLHLPPSHSTPMILVGPGTGVAPFKAFLEQRQMAATGTSTLSACSCVNLSFTDNVLQALSFFDHH